MVAEFDQAEAMRRMSVDSDRPIKPVFHAMQSLPAGAHLDEKQWAYAVETYMCGLGFMETNKYVCSDAPRHRPRARARSHRG
jgi:hypothetical protein